MWFFFTDPSCHGIRSTAKIINLILNYYYYYYYLFIYLLINYNKNYKNRKFKVGTVRLLKYVMEQRTNFDCIT